MQSAVAAVAASSVEDEKHENLQSNKERNGKNIINLLHYKT